MMPIIARLNGLFQLISQYKKNTLATFFFPFLLLLVQSCADQQQGTDSIEQQVQEILSSILTLNL